MSTEPSKPAKKVKKPTVSVTEKRVVKNLEAIKHHQFKPGQSGNPKGRTKGSLNLKTRMKLWFEITDVVTLPDGKKKSVQVLDAMILGLIKKARSGDPYAFSTLMDRFEGKVADRVVMAGDPDAPLVTESKTDIDYDALDSDTLKKVMAARRKRPNG